MYFGCVVKEPSPAIEAVNHDLGIIMMNPAGSSCHEDTGREAQELADRLGAVVIAADRPTSHSLLPDRQLQLALHDEPLLVMENVARKVEKEVTEYGFSRVRFVGRSAGATGVMELALTDIISAADSMYIAEPPGCEDVPEHSGREYQNRLKAQRTLEKTDRAQAKASGENPVFIYPKQDWKDLPPWQQAHRFATMLTLNPLELRYYKQHYNRLLVPNYLGRLVFDHGLRTHVDFAEHSLVLPTDAVKRQTFFGNLQTLRDKSNELFTFDVIQNTLHKSFDLRPFFAERIQAIDNPAADS